MKKIIIIKNEIDNNNQNIEIQNNNNNINGKRKIFQN